MRTPLLLTVALLVEPGATRNHDAWPDFAGRWRGAGVFQGQPATAVMAWESVLAGRFSRLSVSIALGGKPVFEGHAYYLTAPATGTWFDSQGSSYAIAGLVAGDSLVSLWGPKADQPIGRSVYRLLGTDSLMVTDYLSRAGSWSEFGRIAYRRTQP